MHDARNKTPTQQYRIIILFMVFVGNRINSFAFCSNGPCYSPTIDGQPPYTQWSIQYPSTISTLPLETFLAALAIEKSWSGFSSILSLARTLKFLCFLPCETTRKNSDTPRENWNFCARLIYEVDGFDTPSQKMSPYLWNRYSAQPGTFYRHFY